MEDTTTETITHPLGTPDPEVLPTQENDDEPTTGDDAVPTAADLRDGSLRAELRARREELRGERREVIEIPGYRGKLCMRVQPIEWTLLRAKQREVEKLAKKNKKAELNAQADVLLAAVEQIVVRPDPLNDPDNVVTLQELAGYDRPVMFDEQLEDWLGIVRSGSARTCLFETFPDEIAVANTYMMYTVWMSHADEEADDEFLGESGT